MIFGVILSYISLGTLNDGRCINTIIRSAMDKMQKIEGIITLSWTPLVSTFFHLFSRNRDAQKNINHDVTLVKNIKNIMNPYSRNGKLDNAYLLLSNPISKFFGQDKSGRSASQKGRVRRHFCRAFCSTGQD